MAYAGYEAGGAERPGRRHRAIYAGDGVPVPALGVMADQDRLPERDAGRRLIRAGRLTQRRLLRLAGGRPIAQPLGLESLGIRHIDADDFST